MHINSNGIPPMVLPIIFSLWIMIESVCCLPIHSNVSLEWNDDKTNSNSVLSSNSSYPSNENKLSSDVYKELSSSTNDTTDICKTSICLKSGR